ncbi:hypothetical protein [Priestia megaterium]|uniref:hypothetical protein n=1 Tax=Priestia megaterium TaxID=1404 RepID=UPI003FD34C03
MKKLSMLLLVLVIAVVGCSKGNEQQSQEVKGTIEVPQTIKANEKKSKMQTPYRFKLKKKAILTRK